jgi:hypothetical protein
MPEFVFPVNKKLRGKLYSYNRLYAFPSVPEFTQDKLIILDSGAFGLSKSGGKMDTDYMMRLNHYYAKYDNDNIIHVAPDVFLDPGQTMNNFEYWFDIKFFDKIKPVIQFRQKLKLDDSMYKQLLFYQNKNIKFDFLFISNPGMLAIDFKILFFDDILQELKKEFKISHIHILGAGWNEQDIREWSTFKYVDTIDSIAYYLAASKKVSWGSGKTTSFVEIAMNNVKFIDYIFTGK